MLKAQENLKVITDARNLSEPEEHITLDESLQMLNVIQKRIYERVKTHLLHLLTHESGDLQYLKLRSKYIGSHTRARSHIEN